MVRYSRAYYLIPATALSRIGTVAYTIVVTWYISQHAGQQMVGVMNALSGAGIFLASILGFVVIDRFKKKSLLIFYDIFNSLCCLCALILLSSAHGEFIVYILIILSALMSLAATAYSPTSRAIIPEILGHREFEKYNSTYSMVGELSRAVSPPRGNHDSHAEFCECPRAFNHRQSDVIYSVFGAHFYAARWVCRYPTLGGLRSIPKDAYTS